MIGPRRLNAYYDGDGLRFFDFVAKNKQFFTGMSTDVVAHETGHALLDAIRPDLWASFMPEIGAFHEAFGDIMAIVVALGDSATRTKLLQVAPKLDKKNFVETCLESLSEGVRLHFGPNTSSSEPRRALNKLKWQLPSTLPSSASDPRTLTSEVHSFSRVFTGCFWDTLRFVFTATGSTESDLAKAADITAKLLIEATRVATAKDRFFLEVGRRMVLVDEQKNGGKFREAIKSGFAAHNIGLGTSAMLQPTAALAGEGFDAKTGALPRRAVADLKRHTGAGRLSMARETVMGEPVTRASFKREIPLGRLHRKLKGVVAVSDENVLIGASGTRAVVLGALPETGVANDEVETFVNSLVDCGQIQFEPMPTVRAARGMAAAVADVQAGADQVTHAVVVEDGKKVLTRLRFICRAHRQ
jgi:hypothetical protein